MLSYLSLSWLKSSLYILVFQLIKIYFHLILDSRATVRLERWDIGIWMINHQVTSRDSSRWVRVVILVIMTDYRPARYHNRGLLPVSSLPSTGVNKYQNNFISLSQTVLAIFRCESNSNRHGQSVILHNLVIDPEECCEIINQDYIFTIIGPGWPSTYVRVTIWNEMSEMIISQSRSVRPCLSTPAEV